MKTRIFYKLLGAYVLIAVLAVLVAGFVMQGQIKSDLTRWIKEDLMAQAQIIALMPEAHIQNNLQRLAELSHARVTLIDVTGRVIADTGQIDDTDNHLNRPEVQEARLKGQGSAIRYSRTLKADTLYVAITLHSGSVITGYIRLSRPMLKVAESVDDVWYSNLKALLLILMVSFVLAFVFAARIVAPVRSIAAFTDRVRRGDLSGTLMIESRNEIGQLAKNINEMVSELQAKIRQADTEKGKLQAAFASMNEGVMILDSRYRIESINKGVAGIIGRDAGDMVGKTPLEAFRNVDLQDALNRFRQTGEPVLREIVLGDDIPVVLDVNISAVESLSGEEPKTIMVFHDMTRVKKLERMRVDFVANVTHEIKTPLTAIIGFVETLDQGAIEDSATARKFLHTIRENAARLDRLVDDLLTLSNVELGETKLRLEDLSVAEVLEKALMLIQTKADMKNIAVQTNLPEHSALIRADRDGALQVLLNILDNAVKFTPEGGRISITAYKDEEDFMTLTIADTGPGIPKSELPRLGERFYRVDKTRSRELGGTGLGLSIVKHLMQAHTGRMKIESTPGKGTVVSLTFPTVQHPRG